MRGHWKLDIRFRGKEKETGQWVEGNLVTLATGQTYIIPQNVISDNIPQYLVDINTVGQSIGVKDLDGKTAYEDDVIETEGKRWCIQWGINLNGFIAKNNDTHGNVYSSYHLVPKCKIIGNIQDDPELMGGKPNVKRKQN